MKNKRLPVKTMSLLFVISIAIATNLNAQPGYITGDFHQHTTFTDGSWSMSHMFSKNAEFGLDWWANSEHGGSFNRDGRYSGKDLGQTIYWSDSNIVIKGSPANGNMWRWQCLMEYSFPYLSDLRYKYKDKTIFQGFEWNVPGHEHGSVCVIGDQFRRWNKNVNALAEFEYRFDNSDKDTKGGAEMGWEKSTLSGHAKTLEAIEWLQTNHRYTSWVVPAHPERKKKYTIADFRDMNNAGPDVCFGFESMPGHQKSSGRGGYSSSADGGVTYGGAGFYCAQIGGLWDAMLSEGRHWWLFASSDFHDINGDFYPGEFQKTYTYTHGCTRPEIIAMGLRLGNSWVVEGDLIDYMKFDIYGDYKKASMGQTLNIKRKYATISIIVHDPQGENNNIYSDYNKPELDHIDIIAGEVTGIISPEDSLYNVPSVSTTKVIARFDAKGGIKDADDLVSKRWRDWGNGWKEIKMRIEIDKDMYFRLRGSNTGINVEHQTDMSGNPLTDALVGSNNAIKAFDDIWFYSNPIFVSKMKSYHGCYGFRSNEEENITESKNEFMVYPNPVIDQLNIANYNSANIKVTVTDLTGKTIFSTISSDAEITVDMNHQHTGIYLVKIESENNTVTYKVIK